jgi:hypothetical protein
MQTSPREIEQGLRRMPRCRPGLFLLTGSFLLLAVAAAGGEAFGAEVAGLNLDASAVLTAAGVAPDEAGLRGYLKPFMPDATRDKRVAEMIKDLGAEDFGVRDKATKALASLPVFPREALEKAARSKDVEVQMRAEGLIERVEGQIERGERESRKVAVAALRVIAKRKIKGLAAEVVAAGGHCHPSERLAVVPPALAATATAADVAILRRALGGESAWLRSAGAEALNSVLADKADEYLAARLDDPDDGVRILVARMMADRGRRLCLVPLAQMLASKDHSVRWRSAEALRWLSGKRFAYEALSPDDARKAAADKWLAWARGEGQKATLRFPVQGSGAIRLFNGTDLTGWRAVTNGRAVDTKTSWGVTQGVLGSKGKGRGYLYHMCPLTDYELTVEWRWPGAPGGSGVWIMMPKPGGFKPHHLEAQLKAGKAGDFWVVGNLGVKARGRAAGGNIVKMAASSEKPTGQWNRMTIRVVAGKVTVTVNGVMQNEASDCPLTPGHVALESEGAAVEFRRVDVRLLNAQGTE